MAGFSDYISSIGDYFKQSTPTDIVRDISDTVNDSVGARTKILQATKGFGGSLDAAKSVVSEPRKQYNYRVKLNFGRGTSKGIEANIRSIDRPKINFEYSETRVFNSVKRSIASVSFEPITMEIYDDMAGTVTNDIIKMLKNDYLINIDSKPLADGVPIDLAPYTKTKINSIEIHSGSSPINNLIGGALTDIARGGSGNYGDQGNITNFVLSQCNITNIDFGRFDYSNESDPCIITLTFKYQSLSFGRTSVSKDGATFAGSQILNRL